MPTPQFKTLWSKSSLLCLAKSPGGVQQAVSLGVIIGLVVGGTAPAQVEGAGKVPRAEQGRAPITHAPVGIGLRDAGTLRTAPNVKRSPAAAAPVKATLRAASPNLSPSVPPATLAQPINVKKTDSGVPQRGLPPQLCDAMARIACGETVDGNTSPYSSTIDLYNCAVWDESGPEMVYRFDTDTDAQVTATLSNLLTDLDLFILEDMCASDACIAYGDYTAIFNATAGTTYFIVVDGYGGAQGSFTLSVTCEQYGACCDDSTGICNDNVAASNCPPPLRFAANTLCSDLIPPCEQYGACCDDSTGICNDNVATSNCQLPLRFAANTLCSDLDPPCTGPPLGACCLEGACIGVTTEAACLEQGGMWFEGDDCSTVDCQFCGAMALIACGETVDGDTSPYSSTIDLYNCVSWDESGPEMVYQFESEGDELVTATLSNLQSDLDLFILWPDCASDACIAYGNHTAIFNAAGATTYFIVVDGYGGAQGSFTLSVTCEQYGACCDDSTGICNDNVAASNCQLPLRFAANTLCSDLDPPCTGPVACEQSEFPECLGVCPPATHCEAIPASPVVLPSPQLPPDGDPPDCDQIVSQYEGVDVHAMFPGGIDFSDPKHKCFQNVQRMDDGSGNEIETFDSTVEGLVDIGGGPVPVTLTGPVQVVVFGKTGNTTGTFATEILSMSLTGNASGMAIEIRESPSLASTGQTTITDLGGGLWEIDSFFDVFTELSVDGGPFQPQTDGPGRMVLVSVNQGVCECVPNPTGACCLLGDATCIIVTQAECEDPLLGGVYQGDGTACLGMEACCDTAGVCYMADALCCLANGDVPQGSGTVCTAPEACCLFPECFMLDPLCCDHIGGIPLGPGSQCTEPEACCTEGSDCLMDDPLCCGLIMGMPQGPGTVCTAPEACCFSNGPCQMLDPLCCVNQGGSPQGTGSQCRGMEACCVPDGGCEEVDGLCCINQGGLPQGPGSQCWGMMACVFPFDACQDMDGICCMNQGGQELPGEFCLGIEACCFPDGTCADIDALVCPHQGGMPQGPGSQCLGMEACCDASGLCYMADAACCSANGDTPQGPGTDCTNPNVCGPPFDPPDLPTDPTHQARKHRYISVDPKTNPTVDTVLKVEVAQMKRCLNAPTRGCEQDSDCDDVCDDSAGPLPHYMLKCPPANCALTVPPSVCIWSGPCVDLAPTLAPLPTWIVQQPRQDPTGGCKKPGCPPYDPGEDNCCEDDDWMAYLSDTVPALTGGYTSWADVWAALPAGVLQITDCGIVPVVTYSVYACNPDDLSQCSPPLMVGTQRFPANARPTAYPLYGDVCGGTVLPGPSVVPPDGYVSVKDLLVQNLTIINYGSFNLPQMHITWADLHGPGWGIPPNYNLSVADLMGIYVFGLTNSLPWVNTQGGLDPQSCGPFAP